MARLRLCLEEELQINKLHDAEQAANKNGEFDILYQTVNADQQVEQLQQQSTDDENEPVENSEDTESLTGSSDTDTETAEETTDSDSQPAQESFRQLRYTVATEDWESTKQVIGTAASTVGSGLVKGTMLAGKYAWAGLSYLAELGIQYGPGIAQHVYKGVLFLFGKLAKLLVSSIATINKYLARRSRSLTDMKQDITKLRETIALIQQKDTQVDLSTQKFTKVNIINQLKIGENVNLIENLNQLEHFILVSIQNIDRKIRDELGAVRHLTANAFSGLMKSPVNLMHVKPLNIGLQSGVKEGYEPQSELVDAFYYPHNLPGDVVFFAYMPKEDINSLEDITKAYNDACLFFGVDTYGFKTIDSLDYMTVDTLTTLLDKMEHLIDVCISHQTLYENVKKMKSTLKFSFRNYFHTLASSKDKVSLKNSLLEFIYLKSMFIDKVYLTAAMDIHDYASKVLVSGFAYVKDNIKKLS